MVLPAGWVWLADGQLEGLVPHQVGAAAKSSEIALVTRAEDAQGWVDQVDPLVRRQVGDVDAFVSGDFLLSRQHARAEETTRTLYQGPSEVPGVARWVYTSGDRVWWRLAWRSDDRLEQVLAWAPVDGLDDLSQDMRALEGSSTFEVAPMLVVGGHCDTSRTVDRRAVLEASVRREDARPQTAAEALAVDGIVTRAIERCLAEVVPRTGACRVYEGTPVTQGDEDLQGEVLRCVDARERLPLRIQERLDEVRAW